jgi:hypothetical protein
VYSVTACTAESSRESTTVSRVPHGGPQPGSTLTQRRRGSASCSTGRAASVGLAGGAAVPRRRATRGATRRGHQRSRPRAVWCASPSPGTLSLAVFHTPHLVRTARRCSERRWGRIRRRGLLGTQAGCCGQDHPRVAVTASMPVLEPRGGRVYCGAERPAEPAGTVGSRVRQRPSRLVRLSGSVQCLAAL